MCVYIYVYIILVVCFYKCYKQPRPYIIYVLSPCSAPIPGASPAK